MNHEQRPARIALRGFDGRLMTLPDNPESWQRLQKGRDLLLLGLGPGRPELLPFAIAAGERGCRIFWHDCPETLRALARHSGAEKRLPPSWRHVDAAAAGQAARAGCAVYFYRPSMRLEPAYWGPLLGGIKAAGIAAGGRRAIPCARHRPVLLPGAPSQLLHRELELALALRGYRACGAWLAQRPGMTSEVLEAIMAAHGRLPEFALSVNLRGLDAEGILFHTCRALGIPLAIWFVDNPWHVLSALKLPWWRQAALFVTDAGFVSGLREAGAVNVHFLPLAVARHMWRPLAGGCGAGAPVFVGRASFPEKERFFAAARLPDDLTELAEKLLARADNPAGAPNFHWWLEKLAVRPWPGNAVRAAGLGAENCSRQNRARWISGGMRAGLRALGDMAWRELVAGCEPLPPVDYYGGLPDVYGGACAVLNVTSLLLPASLSQRHFDVWAAGGFLLSDATAGLDIFPEELVAPIRVKSPRELPAAIGRLRSSPDACLDIKKAWRRHLLARHGYEHRIDEICAALGVARAAPI